VCEKLTNVYYNHYYSCIFFLFLSWSRNESGGAGGRAGAPAVAVVAVPVFCCLALFFSSIIFCIIHVRMYVHQTKTQTNKMNVGEGVCNHELIDE
jgi:hypothetical protein